MNPQVFQKNLRNDFKFLKSLSSLSDLLIVGIKLPCDGFLIPITYSSLSDNTLIEKLFKWRESNSIAYATRNKTSFNSTKEWLKKYVLDNQNKILFKILNKKFEFIGHIGLVLSENYDNYIEIDNVLRGVKNQDIGIMSESLVALVDWAEKTIFPSGINLRVLESNHHAIKFYEKLDFEKIKSYPLYKKINDKGYNLVTEKENSEDDIEDYYIEMKINKVINLNKMILTAGPSIGPKEIFYSFDATKNGWNENWNYYIKKFEKEFANYIGVKYAIATSSCTGAMQIALMALGIGEGDEVIVPDITWVSTANVVHAVGAIPIFADVNIETWTIDPNSIENKISDKTKAIMPVHMYGHPSKMDRINELSKKYGLKIIEDAAPSIGAEFLGKKVGSFGDFSAFSFQGAKLLVTGEGGMLCTNNENLYKRAYSIWDQGRIPGTFWIEEYGPKFKMSNIQAAIGLGQLERVDLMIEKKREINQWYFNNLKNVEKITFWKESEDVRSICWMTSIRLNEKAKISREEFCKKLKEKNIDSRPVFPSISQYPYWNFKQSPQPNSKLIAESGINLPSGVCLTKNEVDHICRVIIEILKKT